MLVDIDDGSKDSLLGVIVKVLAESVLASAVALKRCSRRFKDLATPLVANAVERINAKWRDAAAKIGGQGGAAITDWLERNEVLTNLDLSSNNISGETNYIMASEVEGESKEVGAKVTYQGREMVVSVGVDSDGKLKLADRTRVLAIADALKVDPVLKTLDLCDNNIRAEGAAAIAEALRGNGVLITLDISENDIGDEGAKALASALRVNAVLT